MKPKFVVCEYLKVYNDIGFEDDPINGSMYKETGISNCECKAYMNSEQCPNRGRCIIAREDRTWKQVSKKSFEGE